MASFIIEGGHPLSGEITPQGAKNEALQIICATLLTKDEVTVENVPDILDVNNLIALLEKMGVEVRRMEKGKYAFRAANPDYQNYSPSYRWTLKSLKVTAKLLKKGEPEKIKAKVILFCAGKDTVVNIPEQKQFADRVPDCEFVIFPEAKHEIYYSTDDVLEPYVDRLIEFLQ